MADNLIMVRNGGTTRIISERKYSKWFKAKGYEKVSQEEVDAYNKATAKAKSKKADA
jgi:hypothetical protein